LRAVGTSLRGRDRSYTFDSTQLTDRFCRFLTHHAGFSVEAESACLSERVAEGCQSTLVFGVDIPTLLLEELHHISQSPHRGAMERTTALSVGSLDVGPGSDQRLNRFDDVLLGLAAPGHVF